MTINRKIPTVVCEISDFFLDENMTHEVNDLISFEYWTGDEIGKVDIVGVYDCENQLLHNCEIRTSGGYSKLPRREILGWIADF